MSKKLFVNLPVKNLKRSEAFFTDLGFEFFGMADEMASVVINEDTQVMLLTEPVFATYVGKQAADAATATQVILVVGVEDRAQVDGMVDRALGLGATAIGAVREEGGRYQRGFADLDGHHWEALCLTGSSD
jgi:predicted lactoylglutathione lyase